jgi:phosphoglycerol transferase MdoB-like AlkP superfamily enzyme
MVVSVLWLAIGIANGVILCNRTTPFTMSDFALVDDVLKMITVYLTVWQIILIALAALAILIALIIAFLYTPKIKHRIDYRKSVAGVLAIMLAMAGLTGIAVDRNWVSVVFGNLNYAYRDYGVPYCFINTWLNTGISRPPGYSREMIHGIFDPSELGGNLVANVNSKTKSDFVKSEPNIVMVQLESFFDPTTMKGVTFSEDPVPNFRKLQQSSSTGYMIVPSIGAGTANTELEVLSGMSVQFFGPGEYPYKTVLKDKTVETMAYDLKSLGYSTHAIHNHRGDFYGRNEVFANMGFDTYTSVEYMNKVAKTPKNFEQDQILTGEIMATLNSTSGKDFVYTISVQGHGSYPTEKIYENPEITALGIIEEEDLNALEYYLQQVHDEDAFIGDLVETLNSYHEDTVLVIYGDHLPPLNISDRDLTTHNVFREQYVIWSNFSMPVQEKNLYAFQLGAEVLNRLDIHQGYLTKFHQAHKADGSYMSELKALQYDMLYGEEYIFGGKSPFAPTKLKMGIKPIRIEKIVEVGSKYYIKGRNFTPYSKVSIDGKVLDTIYLSPTVLGLLDKADPEDVDKMKISQVEKKNILSTTE